MGMAASSDSSIIPFSQLNFGLAPAVFDHCSHQIIRETEEGAFKHGLNYITFFSYVPRDIEASVSC